MDMFATDDEGSDQFNTRALVCRIIYPEERRICAGKYLIRISVTNERLKMKKGYKNFDSLLVVIYDDALVEHSEILSCSSISANKAGRIWRIHSFNEERMRFIARIIVIKYAYGYFSINHGI